MRANIRFREDSRGVMKISAVSLRPRRDCLMKKNEGRKSRDTVPLKAIEQG
jgi:hypothetical protein